MMRVLFTGDVNFRGMKTLTMAESEDILSEVRPYLDMADFRIINLEGPLAEKENHFPIKKSGPNLISAPENICFLNTLGADVATLANNHIGDFGEGAIKDTLALLGENNILYAGAGEGVEKAYEACRIVKDDISVAIISVCENEFGMAAENMYGSAGYEPRRILKQIKQEKAEADYVIVVFHGGNEFCPVPSPDTTERYRLICDMGADAVIATHTHCPQGYELYEGKPIVYSMGNFLFRSSSERAVGDSWYYGYMSILNIGKQIELEIVPYKFNMQATKITVFHGEAKEKMMKYLDRLCEIIQEPKELELHFMGWAWTHGWCPYIPDDPGQLEDYNASANFNLISCEAHNSQLKEHLKILYEEKMECAQIWSDKVLELQEINLD